MYFIEVVLLSFYIKCVFSFLLFFCLLAFLCDDITSQFLGYYINHLIMQLICQYILIYYILIYFVNN